MPGPKRAAVESSVTCCAPMVSTRAPMFTPLTTSTKIQTSPITPGGDWPTPAIWTRPYGSSVVHPIGPIHAPASEQLAAATDSSMKNASMPDGPALIRTCISPATSASCGPSTPKSMSYAAGARFTTRAASKLGAWPSQDDTENSTDSTATLFALETSVPFTRATLGGATTVTISGLGRGNAKTSVSVPSGSRCTKLSVSGNA